MVDYPYCPIIGKIKPFFEKIKRDVGIPSKVTNNWLETIGYKSTNDRPLIHVLKYLGFVEDNKPTDKWREYRAHPEKVMAFALKESYSDLFDTYPNANNMSRAELENYFASKTSGGSQVINKTTGTFTSLCELADFSKVGKIEPKKQESTKEKEEVSQIKTVKKSIITPGMTVNINIQLTVPETTDEKVYEKFFEAMKKHILS